MGKPIADNRQPCVELPRSTKGPGVDAAGAATLLAVACLHDKVTQGSRRRAQLNPLSNWVHEAKSVCDIMPEIRLETMPENRHKPVTEIQRGVSLLYQKPLKKIYTNPPQNHARNSGLYRVGKSTPNRDGKPTIRSPNYTNT